MSTIIMPIFHVCLHPCRWMSHVSVAARRISGKTGASDPSCQFQEGLSVLRVAKAVNDRVDSAVDVVDPDGDVEGPLGQAVGTERLDSQHDRERDPTEQ